MITRRLVIGDPCCMSGPREGKKHKMLVIAPRPRIGAATFMRCRWCQSGGYFYDKRIER